MALWVWRCLLCVKARGVGVDGFTFSWTSGGGCYLELMNPRSVIQIYPPLPRAQHDTSIPTDVIAKVGQMMQGVIVL